MAMARASAASAFTAFTDSSLVTMAATWPLSALPVPTTDFFTCLAAISATSRPAFAHCVMATPRAMPSFSAEAAERATKISSIAALSGRWASTTEASPFAITASLSASGNFGSGWITPLAR